MDPSATSNPADTLSRAAYFQAAHTLRSLCTPLTADTAEDAAFRQADAIAQIASLCPATPDEANIAAYYVAAGAHAYDCIRLARSRPDDTAHFLKCTAQAVSMMRQAHRWRATLLRTQTERERHEAVANDDARPAEPPAPQPAPPSAVPNPEDLAQAERFAVIHRADAILLRRGRHVPNARRANLSPGALRALIAGTTPVLRALDKKSAA